MKHNKTTSSQPTSQGALNKMMFLTAFKKASEVSIGDTVIFVNQDSSTTHLKVDSILGAFGITFIGRDDQQSPIYEEDDDVSVLQKRVR